MLIKRLNQKAFTLAELLIVLSIVGVIASFAIPKLLTSTTNAQMLAKAKACASAVSQAYVLFKNSRPIQPTTGIGDFIDSINTLKHLTTGLIDHKAGYGDIDCSWAQVNCYAMHNGGVLWFSDNGGWSQFGGTTANHAAFFGFDPDGKLSNYKSVEFCMYTTGHLHSSSNILTNTYNGSGGPYSPGIDVDPDWYSW
jgi:prepilin-type N-terminal cleavage/methylation domain-containing protein